ncbi:MAG: DUF4139 domain-containing protein [Candidatus Scalindua rubra]|uniref:DUF4139 domain-containing protein n=1 Tax=Candidatus Scalindua brodae TaxID=237368 RepID=A0A0B0EJG0_9BACT|nr:MAG: hypothetical protein SCABRO_02066 [Candidatus Scalindua brodae]MBZ0107284.1 DUF4139 domain-containing protein [Candidatus Scalindua rubra]TWU32091.1 hypothetical protein S225a_18550 [Candidatus Brocadiaceae bacterium S225]
MKIKLLILFFVIALFPSIVNAENGEVSKSTVDDQIGVEVTVYNNNIGLIKDTRKIMLHSGEGELRFMGVASQIMPVTVHVKSLNYPKGFSIVEQNYEYDLINADKLLDKYVGKNIKIIVWNEYQDRKETVDAVLLSNNNGQIYKIDNEIFVGHPGIKVLSEIPEDLIAMPTLTWLYENKTVEEHNLEVSYLTNSISWKADYVVVLNKEDTSTNISGWVTLDNKSGATYRNTSLKLIAGDVNRVTEAYRNKAVMMDYNMESARAAPQFKEKPFFEYHIYDLQRKTTIKDKQTKQVSLLEAVGTKIQKEFIVEGSQGIFTRQYRSNNPKQSVNVYIKFMNTEDNNLGIPIPEGVMRLYKTDDEGSLLFIGEDRVEHTPVDEEISLKIGEAFDIVAERVQTDYILKTSRLHESEWEITLKNHKKEDVVVSIIEPLTGNWSVTDSSHPYTKKDAYTIKFDVDVHKGDEVKVKYRLRVGL